MAGSWSGVAWRRRASATTQVVLWVAGIAALTAIVAGLAGAFSDRTVRGGDLIAVTPESGFGVPTEVATVVERDVPAMERFPATVKAAREALVSARLLAEVKEVFVAAGARVEAGDVLAALDDRDLVARVEQARESLSAAEARLAEARPAYQRIAELRERRVAPQSDLDSAEATLREAEAGVEGARRALDEAHVSLSFATVTAPFGGVVVDRLAEPGDLASPGTPLLAMYDPAAMRAEAYVREGRARQLVVGDRVGVEVESAAGEGAPRVLEGIVEEIVPQADAASRSVLVKVALPTDSSIYPGLFARLRMEGTVQRRVFVPAAAIRSVGQVRFVEMAEPKGSRRMVTLGADHTADGWTEVASGVVGGDRILKPKS
jgi:RND family efflux transporter MFP subunit